MNTEIEMANGLSCLLILSLLFSLLLSVGCSFSPPYTPESQPLNSGRLPTANTNVSIPNLGPCTDSPDNTLRFNSDAPMTVLVHGCDGSAGRFRSLAQLFAFHGQQAVCFSYDDRDSLVDSSNKLISAIDELSDHVKNRDITLIGHSMGGLVARKASEDALANIWRQSDTKIKLVTVSAPLAGIEASRTCGKDWLHWLTLGLVPASCWAVTGDNWDEITPQSSFIRKVGPLSPSVERYLKVVTDERNTCRRATAEGNCIADDYVFSLGEQYHPVIDRYSVTTNVEVNAGHVEIVGYKDVAPRKLLSILQEQGVLSETSQNRKAALEILLTDLY